MRVTVYTSNGCHRCKGTMRRLDTLNIPYDVVNVSDDEAAADYVRGLGHVEVPVVVVDNGGHQVSWSGHRMDRLNALAVRNE